MSRLRAVNFWSGKLQCIESKNRGEHGVGAARLGLISSGESETIMCGRVRLSSDYSEIKIRLKFAPNSVAPNFEPDWNKPPTLRQRTTQEQNGRSGQTFPKLAVIRWFATIAREPTSEWQGSSHLRAFCG